MKLFNILRQEEVEAYILNHEDYKSGHPAYHPMVLYSETKYHLVVKTLDNYEYIVDQRSAQDYVLVEASEEEEIILKAMNFKMINL